MDINEQITQEEERAYGLMEDEYSRIADLVRALQDDPGDNWAFEEFYELTYPRILYTARHLVNSEQTALDVVQEVYLAFYRNIDRIREPRAVISWLHRTTTGLARDMRERSSAQHETLLNEDQEYCLTNTAEQRREFVPHEQLDAQATSELIGDMLSELPEEQSSVLVYRFVEGLSLAEIADIMACTVSTVKSRLKYGKQKIEERVNAMEKQGIKLYSTSIPMLLACLRWLMAERGALAAEQAAGLLAQVESTVGLTASAAAGAQAAGHTAAAKAGTAAKAGAATKGSAVGTKVVAGVAAAAVIVGGVVGVPKLKESAKLPSVSSVVQQFQKFDDPQAVYDQDTAYLQVIADLQKFYGVRRQISDNAYAGLMMAKRVDFDADGTDELLCAYNDSVLTTTTDNLQVNRNSWFAVYGWDGQRVYQICEETLLDNETTYENLNAYTPRDWNDSADFYLYQDPSNSKIFLCQNHLGLLQDSPSDDRYLYEKLLVESVDGGEWTGFHGAWLERDPTTMELLPAQDAEHQATQRKDFDEISDIRKQGTYYRFSLLNANLQDDSAWMAQYFPNYPQSPIEGFTPPEDPAELIQDLQDETERAKNQLGNEFREYVATKDPARLEQEVTSAIEKAHDRMELYSSQNVFTDADEATPAKQEELLTLATEINAQWQHALDVMMEYLKMSTSAAQYAEVEQECQDYINRRAASNNEIPEDFQSMPELYRSVNDIFGKYNLMEMIKTELERATGLTFQVC